MNNFDYIDLQYGKKFERDDSCEEVSEQPEKVEKAQEETTEQPEQTEEEQEAIPEESGQAEEEKEESHDESEQVEEAQEETPEQGKETMQYDYTKDTKFSKARAKMNCMPEIQCFEEMLASIDKTWTVEKKIYIVLELMGLKNLPDSVQQQIVCLIAEAIKKEPINICDETIFRAAGIPSREIRTLTSFLSAVINGFAKRNGSNKEVNTNEFLSDLKKIIMPDDDIDTNV